MNIVWNQINNRRFVSADGNFSIYPANYDPQGKINFCLEVNYNRKNKVYNLQKLEDCFRSAQNIWNGGRF